MDCFLSEFLINSIICHLEPVAAEISLSRIGAQAMDGYDILSVEAVKCNHKGETAIFRGSAVLNFVRFWVQPLTRFHKNKTPWQTREFYIDIEI